MAVEEEEVVVVVVVVEKEVMTEGEAEGAAARVY